MAARSLDLGHVGLLIRNHAKYAIRGGSGMSFVIIAVIVGLVVASVMVDPLDQIRKTYERENGVTIGSDKFMQSVIERGSPIVAWWLDVPTLPPDPVSDVPVMAPPVEFLLRTHPGLLSVMFLVLLALEPFTIAFAGFNQLSGDIANRGLRYILLRTSRVNLILSRFLGTLVFTAVTSFFTMAVVVTFIAMRFDLYSISDLAVWGLWGWAAINLFSLPYLAFCLWISTAITSPFGALALVQLGIGLPIVALKIAKAKLVTASDLSWLERLTPWGWKFDLVHPDMAKVGLAAAVLVGFFVLFMFLAMRNFLRRDL